MKKPKGKAKGTTCLHKDKCNDKEPDLLGMSSNYPSSQIEFLPMETNEAVAASYSVPKTAFNKQPEDGFFTQAIETAGQPFCSAYPDGTLKAYNQAFLTLMGYAAEELSAKKWNDLVPPDRQEPDVAILTELRRFNRPQLCVTEYLRKDGSRVPVEASVHCFFVDGETDFYYCWFLWDITERRRVEGELQKANQHLSNYVAELEQRNRETELFSEMVSLLQACVSVEEVQIVISRLVRELFSADSGAMYLLNPVRSQFEPVAIWGENRASENGIAPRECWSLRLGKLYLVDTNVPGVLCSHVKHPVRTASLCIPLVAQGETLGLLHIIFNEAWLNLPRDARERQKRHKQQLAITVAENIALSLANFKLRDTLYIQSIHDYLTGLYNRRYMAELLEKELHRMARKKQPAGVIIIDIDRFKGFNDNFGHEAGDIVLREFSLFLRKNIREEDFACRYGGDEFVVILPETSLENARQRAEQLRAGVKNLVIHFRGNTLSTITLSLGVVVYPNHGLAAETLLRTADAALYRAKADGRDRVVSL